MNLQALTGILLFGAEFTQVSARELGHEILPAAGAVAVAAEVRAQQGLVPVGAIAVEKPPAQIIEVAISPAGRNPLGALLAVTAASFVVGLLARRRAEEAREPVSRIREGFAGLAEQAAENLADLLQRARSEVARRVS